VPATTLPVKFKESLINSSLRATK